MKNLDSLKYFLRKSFFELLEKESISLNDYAIAGGAIRDYLTGEKIKDIDVFCANSEAEKRLLKYLRENHTLINENDILGNFTVNDRWVQVIKGKYYDLSTASLIESFDFTMCGAMMKGDGTVLFLPTFFQDTLAKHLRINKITFPLSTLERMQKYIKKGYTACNGTLLSIAESLKTVDLTNPKEDTLRFYPDGTPRFLGID